MKTFTNKELKAQGFICTDASETTEQWVKKLSPTRFEVLERPHHLILDIDLKDYTETEIKDYISGYYDSLEELREMYGEDSNMIIAECISEQTIFDVL